MNKDELIGAEGTYKKRTGVNRFKVPMQSIYKGDKFVDAKSDLLSTIPRTKEEHEELDNLNNNFSARLDELRKGKDLPGEKEKTNEDKDEINKNKKRVVTT
ncbi:uncharacterized protein OCT59_025381 [Rhizophagus irregularis]|uniref:Uncharacterized protein n=2 Tax=Rhizophagus irregularis TaxID=588596 RepID=A0A015K6T8_RHIIW|nr:hypothetical protein RirG_154520 [Rhizophagus irregularis DAOM 197198w]UZO05020.1 hypothetical protein OCT59_025381 [Rhizophagus irregularis]GET51606.1 hypothetical protein GLOIN_2v1774312 [Rhizophagus irregularis DAOM 181602=DAOM 197198]